MVYRLYGLTYDEVKTIEPDYSSMSREEYEAYCSVSESDPEFEAQMAVAREVMKENWAVLRELAK